MDERSGWMKVDLGVPTAVTRAVIQEVITVPRVPLVVPGIGEVLGGE
jgi:hypothetical protein